MILNQISNNLHKSLQLFNLCIDIGGNTHPLVGRHHDPNCVDTLLQKLLFKGNRLPAIDPEIGDHAAAIFL